MGNIIDKDILSLEDHFDSWNKESRIPIAFIRYESMWDHQNEISNFLGFKIKLPAYRERKSTSTENEVLHTKLIQNYSSFIDKINDQPDFKVNHPHEIV